MDLKDLNKFLAENDPKKARAFKVSEEEIPEYAKKQIDAQMKIYETLSADKDLFKKIMDFGFSYGARFKMDQENVAAVCLAILVHLVFIKKIKINN